MTLSVTIAQLPHGEGLALPSYETAGAAGMDLRAAITETETLLPGERRLIPCGVSIALPDGYEAQVRSRSGMAARYGAVVLNSPGTIDSDYRGEVKVILANLGNCKLHVERGGRIAQMVVAPVSRVEWVQADSVGETARGAGGFGSTGVGA
jgi:dUTP pyrophosphatase